MLSNEEKKAIEVLQYVKNKTPFIFWYEDKPYNRKETINTILNLFEKQQKEIEELKDEYSDEKIRNTVIKRFNEVIEKDYVSKNKIKAKIEEYKEKCKNCNFRGKICDEFIKNYECTIGVCLKEFYSLLEKE